MTVQLFIALVLLFIVLIIVAYSIRASIKDYKEFCKRLDRDVEDIKKDIDNGN